MTDYYLEGYLIVVGKDTHLHTAIHQVLEEVRPLLKEGWVPAQGYSHTTIPDGKGEFIHIITQPMIR